MTGSHHRIMCIVGNYWQSIPCIDAVLIGFDSSPSVNTVGSGRFGAAFRPSVLDGTWLMLGVLPRIMHASTRPPPTPLLRSTPPALRLKSLSSP